MNLIHKVCLECGKKLPEGYRKCDNCKSKKLTKKVLKTNIKIRMNRNITK